MAVSFSGNAKMEICRSIPAKPCCALAECFGILLFCNSFRSDGIRIITESREFGLLLPKLFKRAFGVTFDQYPQEDVQGKLNFQITAPEKILQIMAAYGFDATAEIQILSPTRKGLCGTAALNVALRERIGDLFQRAEGTMN